ncbi:aminopeptidase [Bifidobacterium dentium]|uniref:aminopeptidase n=1 Tax=Bifidobacterium dentium TaxID=1689 RepID=UPI00189E0A72|nr:aminopeptidase [Bifidobacterium dentium]
MTTEKRLTVEPVIWFEGTLIRDPQPHGGQDDWLLETLADADGPKITIHGRGAEHSANIRDNAHKGSRLMVKGTAGDEGSGIDIEAISLAFDPSHDEPDGKR